MAKEYSAHQQKIIRNYYENMDTIQLTKLQEIVTDLYLAESDKKRKQLWTRVEQALNKLKVPAEIKARILETQDIKILAKNLQEWLR
jgi:hypothetical protein